MKIKELIKSLDTVGSHPDLDNFEVKGISCNSKTVKNNFVFVAVKGSKEDGSKYIDEAIASGARAVIVDSPQCPTVHSQKKIPIIRVRDTRKALAKLAAEFYDSPSSKIKVVGITGTNGKTTITYLIEALLKEAGAHPAVIGTINYRFKDKVLPSKNTTPGPVELQSMLAQMSKEGVNFAIMEVSSHALDQDRTQGVIFSSAIFTNLTQDHLDYHKTLASYFQAKAKLFKNLSPSAFAVINNDDKQAAALKEITKAKVITFGIENDALVKAEDIKSSVRHTEFLLSAPKTKINVRTSLIGRHNVYNILAAAAWAQNEGIDTKTIKSAIERFSLVPGRLERIESARHFSVFVDYAHTEDALKNVIRALRHIAEKRIIVVFGCGGERDRSKRPKMGRTVTELADYAIITNDNPRSEEPLAIIRDIKKGVRKNNYLVIPERSEAIKKSLSLAREGDVVLVAGKGHENYQILKDKTIDFSDREAVQQCLKSMSFLKQRREN